MWTYPHDKQSLSSAGVALNLLSSKAYAHLPARKCARKCESLNEGFVCISVIAWFYTKDVTAKKHENELKTKTFMAVNSMNYEVIKRDIHNSILFKPLSLTCEQN